MTFLPIVERELRTAARQRVTHRMRLVAAILALVIWFLLSVFGNMTSPQRAQAIFGTISILSLGFAMLAGAFLTADCLSEERREGTLGLLFLTDLKGHDVVLGKLTSTSLHSIYGLLAVVPMLAVPLLMGGVTAGEFARTALVLLTTLFLSLSAGMFISAVSHDSRAAFLRTLGIMVFLSGVLPLFWWGQRLLFRARPFDLLLWPSPGYALRCAGDAFYSTRSGAGEFWGSLLCIGGLGVLLLTAASVLLPRVWRQTSDESSRKPATRKRNDDLKVALESRPYFWLAARDERMGRWAGWIIGIALLFWFAFYLHSSSGVAGGRSFVITFLVAFALHVLFKCMIITEATRRLSEDRQSGALELLLVTPLPPAEIVAGQRAALARLFRWPKAMLIVINLLLIGLIIWPAQPGLMGPELTVFTIMFTGGIALLFADCFVIGPVAACSALTTSHHSRAILKTIRTVLLPSWVAILFFWFFAVMSNGISSETVTTMVVAWIILGVIVDGIAYTRATTRLNSDFRELVATGAARELKVNSEGDRMNVLPVIVRELRAQSRQSFTFWLRMLGVIALLGGASFFMLNFAFALDRGGALFGHLHLMLLCAVWILVPLGAADCLSRERREGTLGLLFLTPLKPRDIVVAKGLTHGLRGMTLLVAVLPVLTIPFLIGGVSWLQAVASALINFTAICWALAAALVASAMARSGIRAMALAAFFAALAFFVQTYFAGLLLGSGLGRNFRGGYSHLDFNLLIGFAVNGLHPEAWRAWTGTVPTIKAPQLIAAIVESAVIAVLILAVAVLFAANRVRRSWQEEPPSVRMQQIQKIFCEPVIWVSFLRRWMRRKLERNPIGWLEQRRWSGRLVTWTWFAIIVSVQTTAITDNTFFRGYAVWENLMAWLLALSIAASAAGSFRRERETGALELLLVSPLTSGQIIGGRLRGLWGQFLPSIVLLLGVWIYFANIMPNHEGGFDQIWFFAITYLVLPVIGLYFSVSCRHFMTAFVFTLGTVIAAPMLCAAIAMVVWRFARGSFGFGAVNGADLSGGIWGAQLLFAAVFGLLLYRRLESRSFPLERSVM